MKAFIAAIGFCLAVAAGAAAQMPKYGITVTPEKDVDYGKLSTYTWSKGQPSSIPSIDAAIIAAVDRELLALGMTKAASGSGDVLVTYYSLSRTDVDVNAEAVRDGGRPEHAVGTLVVALLDPGSRRRLLRLRVDEPITADPAELQATIDGAVAAMFARYPERRK